jgi:hypothetical protein
MSMKNQALWRNALTALYLFMAAAMAIAVLWLTGEIDTVSALAGQTQIGTLWNMIPAIPWRSIVACIALLVLAVAVVAAWGNVRHFIETHRSASVKIIE